jgi:hypothetical protein
MIREMISSIDELRARSISAESNFSTCTFCSSRSFSKYSLHWSLASSEKKESMVVEVLPFGFPDKATPGLLDGIALSLPANLTG